MDQWLSRRRSESLMARNIRMKMKTKKPILLMGDWSSTFKFHFKGLAPMPQVGLRRRLGESFLVLNTREAYTSKTCSNCLSDVSPFIPKSIITKEGEPETEMKPDKKDELEIKPDKKAEKTEAKKKEIKDIRGLRKCETTLMENAEFFGIEIEMRL